MRSDVAQNLKPPALHVVKKMCVDVQHKPNLFIYSACLELYYLIFIGYMILLHV